MDNQEAREILRGYLESFRNRAYAKLAALIGEPQVFQFTTQSGNSYQVEIEARWDNQPDGNLRVMGSIDDGGWRAFLPLCESFIMAPDGSFVGESRCELRGDHLRLANSR